MGFFRDAVRSFFKRRPPPRWYRGQTVEIRRDDRLHERVATVIEYDEATRQVHVCYEHASNSEWVSEADVVAR